MEEMRAAPSQSRSRARPWRGGRRTPTGSPGGRAPPAGGGGAARPAPLPRPADKLVGYLWPGSHTSSARHSLSDSIYVIRKALGEDAILSEGDDLRLSPEVVASDVREFEAALEAGDFERAAGLYAGPFLDGFYLGGETLEFDEWVGQERERLARSYGGALERLAMDADPGEAIGWWRQLVEHEPENSRAVAGLMAALAAAGDRAGALRKAEEHARHLAEEYGAEPDPTVTALAERIRDEPGAWVPPATAKAPGPEVPAREVTPTRPGWAPGPVRRGALVGATAGAALVLLAGVYASHVLTRGSPQPPLVPETLAVVPFRVSQPELGLWSEGMVDLLSTNLDGVGGLRTIDSRTVIARWRETVTEDSDPDLMTALDVARRAGARYLVLGSVVGDTSRLQLTADIYATSSGVELGNARAVGDPGSLFDLVEELSVETLGVILRSTGSDLAAPHGLRGITTHSIEALREYLEGEALFRQGRFAEASLAYEEAVAADSTFALALYRLASTYGWLENVGSDTPGEYLGRALRFADRLPPREAIFVRANYALHVGTLEGVAPLQRAVRLYHDDPEGWWLLGDTYAHLGQQAMSKESEVDRALGRAVGLAPDFSPYYIHLVERAVRKGARAEATRLTQRYGQLAAASRTDRRNRLALALAFGGPDARARTLAAIDTIPSDVVWGAAGFYLSDAHHSEIKERVLRQVRSRPDASAVSANLLFFHLLNRGRLREAYEQADDPLFSRGLRAYAMYALYSRGLPLPDAEWDRLLEALPTDTLPEVDSFYAGAYAATRGQWGVHAEAVSRQRAHAERLRRADSVAARFHEGAARSLEGLEEWKTGRRSTALTTLESARRLATGPGARNRVNATVRWWIAELLVEAGRLEDAARYYESQWEDTYATDQIARIHETLGEDGKAEEAYRYVASAWMRADAELDPRVARAREYLAARAR